MRNMPGDELSGVGRSPPRGERVKLREELNQGECGLPTSKGEEPPLPDAAKRKSEGSKL